jgi:plastocyanin
MKTRYTLFIVLLLAAGISQTTQATIYTVEVANFSFTPNTLNIHSGDTVKWIWVSGTHTTTSTSVPAGAASWDSPITTMNTEFQIQLTVAGNYSYDCSIHPTMMTGTITVSAASDILEYKADPGASKTYPNPFSDLLSIVFTQTGNAMCKITIFDLTGTQVRELASGDFGKGEQKIIWDARNDNGDLVKEGMYYYYIERNGMQPLSGKIIYRK